MAYTSPSAARPQSSPWPQNAPWMHVVTQNPYVQQAHAGYVGQDPLPSVAGRYVQGVARRGVPWAQKLLGSPWATGRNNTAAGWQAAGYGPADPNFTPAQGVGPGGSSPSTPGQKAPTAPKPPTYPSPLDAQYFTALNNATLQANNRINASNLTSSYARTDLQNQLAQLAHQQSLQTQQQQEAENARGGFAQGHLGQQIGELNRSYLDRQSAGQQQFDRGEAARSAARAAIAGGLSLEQAALAAAAAERATNAAIKNPAVGSTGPSLTAPAGGHTGGSGGAGHGGHGHGHGQRQRGGLISSQLPEPHGEKPRPIPKNFRLLATHLHHVDKPKLPKVRQFGTTPHRTY